MKRTGATLIRLSVLSVLAALASCAPRDGSPSAGSEMAAGPRGSLSEADLAAYTVGVERETALNRAAIAALRRTRDAHERAVLMAGAAPALVVSEGARAAGLPVDRYRDVVMVVDSILIGPRGPRNGRAGDSGAAQLHSGWPLARLDSQRIALGLSRAELAAESAR